MKLKINDRYYITQCYPEFCHGCAFEHLNICTDRFGLLNDLCVQKNIIYIENESIKVLDYENSIPK
jgi:hypothetical protein